MRITKIMTSPAITVAPTATLADATSVLVAHDATSLPVVDDVRRLVGIVGEDELFRVRQPMGEVSIGESRSAARRLFVVRDVMRQQVLSVRTSDTLALCQRLLVRHAHTLPVIERGRVVGTISRRDVLAAFVRPDAEVREAVEHQLTVNADSVGGWTVSVYDGSVTVVGTGNDRQRRRVGQLVKAVTGVSSITITSRSARAPGRGDESDPRTIVLTS